MYACVCKHAHIWTHTDTQTGFRFEGTFKAMQTNMFTSAKTQIPNNVLLQVHSRLPGDSHLPPDLGTTSPSQPRGPNPCTAKTCSQINAGTRRKTNNEYERAQKGEKHKAGLVLDTVLQRPTVQDGWTNTPARTGGTTQSGNMTKTWTLQNHHEWLYYFQSVGAWPSQKQRFHFLFAPEQHPECQLRLCAQKSFST